MNKQHQNHGLSPRPPGVCLCVCVYVCVGIYFTGKIFALDYVAVQLSDKVLHNFDAFNDRILHHVKFLIYRTKYVSFWAQIITLILILF